MQTTEPKTGTVPIIESLKWRYACKKFDSTRKLDGETWAKLEEAMVLSASSFGLQPWKFVVVTDQAIKDQLPSQSWGQGQPAECSHLVVISRPLELKEADVDHYLKRIAEVRGTTVESLSAYAGMMKGFVNGPADKANWMSAQCYIALGTLLTAAAALGVDACPMEGFDKAAYDRILGLTERGLASVVVCPLGYRAADDKYASTPKVRFPASELIIKI
jgi:nitroreductase